MMPEAYTNIHIEAGNSSLRYPIDLAKNPVPLAQHHQASHLSPFPNSDSISSTSSWVSNPLNTSAVASLDTSNPQSFECCLLRLRRRRLAMIGRPRFHPNVIIELKYDHPVLLSIAPCFEARDMMVLIGFVSPITT